MGLALHQSPLPGRERRLGQKPERVRVTTVGFSVANPHPAPRWRADSASPVPGEEHRRRARIEYKHVAG
jgi:hypothetical protein